MKRKVLVADDEPSILRSTSTLLEDLGFDVVSVNDARLILATAVQERPDILLQDVRMPGLDFDRLVAEVRGHPALAATRLVVFTASMDAAEVAERVGLDRVLEKPFHPQDLLRAIEAAA